MKNKNTLKKIIIFILVTTTILCQDIAIYAKTRTQYITNSVLTTTNPLNGSQIINGMTDEEYVYKNYQGMASDGQRYLYVVQNMTLNGEEKAIRIMRVAANGSGSTIMKYNGSTVIKGITHGNATTCFVNGKNTYIGMTSQGGLVICELPITKRYKLPASS